MDLTKEISEAVKEARHKRRLNQTEFGKLAGVKQSQIARWESMDGKYIKPDTWANLKPLIEEFISDQDEVTYIPEFLPLPEVIQSGEELTNYKRQPLDRLYGYGSNDMEPIIPTGSRVLIKAFEEPMELPKEYIPMVQMRINLPHGELVLVKWGDSDEYKIRRIVYKNEGQWYAMHLTKANGFENDAIKL